MCQENGEIDECTKSSAEIDIYCSYCPVISHTEEDSGLHFLLDHLFNFYVGINSCPVCNQPKGSLSHVFLSHTTKCLFCLKELVGGYHQQCLNTVQRALYSSISEYLIFKE